MAAGRWLRLRGDRDWGRDGRRERGFHMVDQDKPVLLITGASSGIGEAATRRFAAAGYNVVAVARRKEMLDKLAADLSDQTEVLPFATSVAEDGVAEKATALCMDRFGRL